MPLVSADVAAVRLAVHAGRVGPARLPKRSTPNLAQHSHRAGAVGLGSGAVPCAALWVKSDNFVLKS